MKHLLLAVLCLTSVAWSYPLIPDDKMTVGSLCDDVDPDFAEYRYNEKIPYCKRNVASSLKAKIYEAYKIPKEERTEYTIDHFIPLSIGGTNNRDNLWPEHKEVKALRPALEMQLFVAMRDGKMLQEDAIAIIKEKKMYPCSQLSLDYLPPPRLNYGRNACDVHSGAGSN